MKRSASGDAAALPRRRELTGGTDSLGSFSSHGMHPSSCPPWPQCARVALPLAVLYLSRRFEYAVTMDREMSGIFERADELARDKLHQAQRPTKHDGQGLLSV